LLASRMSFCPAARVQAGLTHASRPAGPGLWQAAGYACAC